MRVDVDDDVDDDDAYPSPVVSRVWCYLGRFSLLLLRIRLR